MKMNYLGAVTDINTMPPDVGSIATKAQDISMAIADSIAKLMPLVRDQQLFNAQLKLAKANAQQAGGYIDPSKLTTGGINMNVGLDPNTKNLIFYGLIGLAVVLLLRKR